MPCNSCLDLPTSECRWTTYHWPGNIRELRNVIERAVLLSGPGRLDLAGLNIKEEPKNWSYTVRFPLGKTIHNATKEMKRSLVLEALRRSEGSRQVAANLSGVSRHALAQQMRAAGLDE